MKALNLLVLLSLVLAQTALAETRRYVVEGADAETLEKLVAKHRGQHLHRANHFRGIVAHLDEEDAGRLLKANSRLRLHEDTVISLVRPKNGFRESAKAVASPQTAPWGVAAIRAASLWSITKGAGVKVCIVDTGIDKTHPDLQANIVGGRNFVASRSGFLNSTNWNDDNGHGSHVAGIIAALDNSVGVVGVAPKASLYSVKVLDSRGSGYLSDVTDGVYECINKGSHIINMSLGASGDPGASSPMKTAIEGATALGIKVVVAAGNEGANINQSIPAGYATVIPVAASDIDGRIASWSNFGLAADDHTAPGVAIRSTWKSGGYSTISGTSMAAPHVAGALALQLASPASVVLDHVTLGYPVSSEGAGLIQLAPAAP